ncbi:tetratricopeptide repeat protein [Acidithiobacillus sp. CV18-2]|uniref:Tetratricopeptide repeat protein n=1 Tax=Igneacidithiobacillus copahuensis TaxID=2724909 RepID=A0AAE2YRZ7_9PROT|nr:tetratricopeptide repeat protein [Igneacidithiobacillus copahuensis]MBU2753203.1 tetratricopeptide repeat protein [Acidithiobacillus sp. CV18-3]MBU2758499.1 tetratricopeptide repeat protein [Acidithiobacillus sp. BN09-2]MBU2777612.1 tetratricopeptide repeat protein [Acidithiobacillus sp. CV18-2]MBU2797706.1 tetratricopeptide repeat protein [Acidithiobacillus sp. VAN18-2]MBU2798288.1 tetratricopeptide repeat protein [Acidithiobacillus sp. VAN18-4]UTV80696.1 tetratricopeptide repeat protein 
MKTPQAAPFSLDDLIQDEAERNDDFAEGLDWQQTGHFPEAVKSFRKALDAEPDSPLFWTFYAWALAESGDVHGAIAACRKAIGLDPEWGIAWNDLGEYLMESGRIEEALFPIRKALRSKHFDRQHLAYMNLARYYLHHGQLRRARQAAEEAHRLLPIFHPAKELAEWIRERQEAWGIDD